MKLFYAPGSCALSPHIALVETGLPFEIEKVDFATRKTADGRDYTAINPKGAVPALQLDDGQVLTEGAAIVQYIADRKPESKLAPAAGTIERYRLQEWLNYIGTELHKSFSPLFTPGAGDELKAFATNAIKAKFGWLDKQLAGRSFLLGQDFTVADGYLYTILSWTRYVGIDLAPWPALAAYLTRIEARPGVQEARKAEGLNG